MSKKLTIEFILNKANHNNPKSIRVLNLRGSQISDISILSELTALESISLSANQIKDISVFKKLKNIRELYLKDNQINDFAQFENLKNCKKIEKLAIKGNPITTMPNYIQKIVEILPQIKKLDDIELKQFKLNIINNKNGNFNSPLIKKDSNQSQNRNIDANNNYNIQSPNTSNNNISIKSGSESISSDIKGEAKNVSAAILKNDIPVASDYELPSPLPKGLVKGESGEIGIYIGIHGRSPFKATLQLIPRILTLGIGCRKGTGKEQLMSAIKTVLADNDLDFRAVGKIVSIDIKKDEEGLISCAKALCAETAFYTADELSAAEGDFSESEFVRKTVGTGNVCERSAAISGGKMIVRKTALDGITVAVAVKDWRVEF